VAHKEGAAELHRARNYRGLRTSRYTYVIDHDGPWLLYDHHHDPDELDNLVDDPAHAEARTELHQRLLAMLADYADDLPRGEELVARWGYQIDESGTIAIQ